MVLSWELCQVNFDMAYPQAPIKCNIYMKTTDGVDTDQGSNKSHFLNILKNIYRQKREVRVWNDYITSKLLKLGSRRSLIDECVFYRDSLVFLVYVDNSIFVSLEISNIDDTIK